MAPEMAHISSGPSHAGPQNGPMMTNHVKTAHQASSPAPPHHSAIMNSRGQVYGMRKIFIGRSERTTSTAPPPADRMEAKESC